MTRVAICPAPARPSQVNDVPVADKERGEKKKKRSRQREKEEEEEEGVEGKGRETGTRWRERNEIITTPATKINDLYNSTQSETTCLPRPAVIVF